MAGISIRGLGKRFAGGSEAPAAVADLTLDIKDNQFVTLLGPSGCGKTTTLRLIAGYLTPDAGTIEIAGRLMSSPQAVVPPEERGMGMVFQNYAVWPHKTVFENVVFGLRLRKVGAAVARQKVAEMLALVNLAGLEARYPGELSGGQQQRVALARSLVVEPGILLLDEPLSNLDAKLRERMRVELKQIQRRTGITFVYVTHDQSEALALSDQVAVISGGRLQQYGTPFEVYAHPASRRVADFMGLVNLLGGRVREIRNGAAIVDLAEGLGVTVVRAEALTVGQRVDVAIRPENISLAAPSASDAAAGMRGRVASHTFLGNLSEYEVALPSGLLLRAQTHPRQRFMVGEEVTVAVEVGECSAFPVERGARDGDSAA